MNPEDYIRKAIRLAEEMSREDGTSFEGWLWYILRPDSFMLCPDNNTIEITYYTIDADYYTRFIIDRKTHEIIRVEEGETGEEE